MSEKVIDCQMSDEDVNAKDAETQFDGEKTIARRFAVFSYSFRDRIKAGIYENLWIDMGELESL